MHSYLKWKLQAKWLTPSWWLQQKKQINTDPVQKICPNFHTQPKFQTFFRKTQKQFSTGRSQLRRSCCRLANVFKSGSRNDSVVNGYSLASSFGVTSFFCIFAQLKNKQTEESPQISRREYTNNYIWIHAIEGFLGIEKRSENTLKFIQLKRQYTHQCTTVNTKEGLDSRNEATSHFKNYFNFLVHILKNLTLCSSSSSTVFCWDKLLHIFL